MHLPHALQLRLLDPTPLAALWAIGYELASGDVRMGTDKAERCEFSDALFVIDPFLQSHCKSLLFWSSLIPHFIHTALNILTSSAVKPD